MGINPYDFRLHIVKPALMQANMWSQSAENLIIGIALVESGLKHLVQIGNVPNGGLGITQMQKITHDDIANYLTKYPVKQKAILDVCMLDHFCADALIFNLRYAVLMTRAFFLRFPEPLPDANDAKELCNLHKTRYNTSLGKTDVSKSILLFQEACK